MKNEKQFLIKLSTELQEKFYQLANKKGWNKSKIIRNFIEKLVRENDM